MSVALENKVSAVIFHSYTDSNNKNLNDIELQLNNMRTTIKNLDEHQNIESKQTQEHRPATSGNDEVNRDSDTTRVQQLVYVTYVCTPTVVSIHMIFDMCMLRCMLIFFCNDFLQFSKFSWLL